jgi:hypothetical protein
MISQMNGIDNDQITFHQDTQNKGRMNPLNSLLMKIIVLI